MSSQFQVFNGLHFAFLVKTKGLSQSKNEHKQLFWNLLMTSAYGRRAGLAKSLQIGIRGLSAVNFICSSYTWVEMDSTQLPSDFESCGDVNIWCRGGGVLFCSMRGRKKFGVDVMKPFHCAARQYINIWSTIIVSAISYICIFIVNIEISSYIWLLTMIQYG